jgi:hypothetical protein
MTHGDDMDRSHLDNKHLTITGAHKAIGANVDVKDDVMVIVTQAFGPDGDPLVGISDVTFDGFSAVTLLVEAAGRRELVHLSPVHGDHRKVGLEGIPEGTKCTLFCPTSKKPLVRVGRVDEDSDAEYFAIYLTPRLSDGDMVAVSDVWGDYHSRIVDNFELISFWATGGSPA